MEDVENACDVFSRETSEKIRKEFKRLGNLCYLDQTSCALYPNSYVEKALEDLATNVYSNPHSSSTTSKHCTDSIDQVRYKILQHFNTDVDEYSVIFTSGATDAIKLLANCFKWKQDDFEDSSPSPSEFVYMEDNHTSILGMRDLVSSKGCQVRCMSHDETIDTFRSTPKVHQEKRWSTNSLFAYSAQCNFSGVKYPLQWVKKVHHGVLSEKTNWYCLLDAASYVSTTKLDLSAVQPDFVCISFYKIFGYPTGIGALLVRNKSAEVLEKLYYGGGTVLMALSSVSEHVPRPALHERFEDGSLNYLSIIALNQGFNTMEDMVGDYNLLGKHCFNIAKYAFFSLLRLHHRNGFPAVKLYADTPYDDDSYQGNIVNFNMIRANGDYIGYAEVLNMANIHDIQLRTGCFCNPGACRRHLNLTTDDVRSHYAAGHVCGDDNDLVDGKPTGSVRISFGVHNTKNDVDRLLKMLETCFVLQPAVYRLPETWLQKSKDLRSKFDCGKRKSDASNKSDMIQSEGKNVSKDKTFDVDLQIQHPLTNLRIDFCNDESNYSQSERYDRQWMITTDSGVALTQKSEPMMCLIRPFIDEANNRMRLTCKGSEDIWITLNPHINGKIKDDLSLCQSKVCGDRIRGYDCGDDVADWLSLVLNRSGVRLIRQLPDDNRKNKKNSGSLTLSNQSQFLFINESSVKWLADKLEEDSECNKVDGPCSRCQMICIDQETGLKTKEPLTTLTAAFQGKMKFGIYLSRQETHTVSISVGDEVISSVE